jgi:heme-degrading monooxygenase HmoA
MEFDRQREYLALATYLPRKSYWAILSFFRQTRAIQSQLESSDGLVGYSLRAQLLGKKSWTLSVWKDEAALTEFVRKAPHKDTMKGLRPQLTDARRFVRWKVAGSGVPPGWGEALRRIDEEGSGP